MPRWPPGWCSPKSPVSAGVNLRLPVSAALPALAAVTLLVAPAASPQPPGFDLQAHQGGGGETTGESLRAFAKALELGISTLEFDISITKDGQPLGGHDPTIEPEKCK